MVFETNGRLMTILNYTFEKVVKYYNNVKVYYKVKEYKRQVKRFFFKRTLKHGHLQHIYQSLILYSYNYYYYFITIMYAV